MSIQGFGIRSIDDSREGVGVLGNPTTSVVAEQNGRIVGAILCGHDGSNGFFYHVYVALLPAAWRKAHGHFAMKALREGKQGESHRLQTNEAAMSSGTNVGWVERSDTLNYYDFIERKDHRSFIKEGLEVCIQ